MFKTPQTEHNTPKQGFHVPSAKDFFDQSFTIAEVEHKENISKKRLAKLRPKQGYDYNSPASLTMAYRIPDNLIGGDLRNATKYAMNVN